MKKTFRTILGLLLASALLVAVCGCTPRISEKPTETPVPSEDVHETPSPEPTAEPEPTPSSAPTPSPTPEIQPLVLPEISIETKTLEPVLQPEAGENGKVFLNPIIPAGTRRTVEYWVDDPYKPDNAFGDREDSYVKFDQGLPVTLRFYTKVKIRITDYSFVTQLVSDDTGANRPASWKLYGSNLSNHKDEVLLDARENIELPMENGIESELFEIENPDYYEFYRLVFEKSAGNTDTVEFDDINFYGEDGNCVGDYILFDSSIEAYTIMNGALNTKMSLVEPFPQADLGISGLYDCDIETRSRVNCQYAKEAEYVDFIFAFKQPVQIDAYRFTTYETGCPVTWTLFGSNDKKLTDDVVVAIDTHTQEAMPGYDYAETDVFEIQNKGSYKYYKLRVYEEVCIGNDENWLYVSWRDLTLLMKNENVSK